MPTCLNCNTPRRLRHLKDRRKPRAVLSKRLRSLELSQQLAAHVPYQIPRAMRGHSLEETHTHGGTRARTPSNGLKSQGGVYPIRGYEGQTDLETATTPGFGLYFDVQAEVVLVVTTHELLIIGHIIFPYLHWWSVHAASRSSLHKYLAPQQEDVIGFIRTLVE